MTMTDRRLLVRPSGGPAGLTLLLVLCLASAAGLFAGGCARSDSLVVVNESLAPVRVTVQHLPGAPARAEAPPLEFDAQIAVNSSASWVITQPAPGYQDALRIFVQPLPGGEAQAIDLNQRGSFLLRIGGGLEGVTLKLEERAGAPPTDADERHRNAILEGPPPKVGR